MDLETLPLPPLLVALTWMASIPALALALLVAPWHRLRDNLSSHVWCGGILLTLLLWSARGSGLELHLLGMAGYALLAGPALALVGAAIALAIDFALHGGHWWNAGASYAIVAVAPVVVVLGIVQVARRWHAPHPFVHATVIGWVAGLLSLAVAALLHRGLLEIAVSPVHVRPWDQVMALIVCLASCEAMLTGLAVMLFAIHVGPPVRSAPAPRKATGRSADRPSRPTKS